MKLLKKSLMWIFGNGKSTSFWHDNWYDISPIIQHITTNMIDDINTSQSE